MSNALVHDVLRRVPLFKALTDAELTSLAEASVQRPFAAGQLIFRQGDRGDALYVVLTGSVRLFKTEDGREFELGIERAGDFFGEMSLFDGAPRSASAMAAEESSLLVVSSVEHLTMLGKSSAVLTDAVARLTRNLRASNAHRFGLVQEQEHLKAESELERLRSLSQMVAGVAHEINTPLGIIQNAASLVNELLGGDAIARLAKDDGAKEALADIADACQLIQKNIAVASRLITSFKSLSVRQLADLREEVDLLQVVSETVDLYRLKARASKLELHLECKLPAAERSWNGFPGHLSQVLLNLLTNVDRYAYPAGAGGKVDLILTDKTTTPGHRWFEVVVRDFGQGIAEENLPRIFNPFFTTGRDKQGTGVGLASGHNNVTGGLCGTVRVESTPGAGAAFFIGFPQTIPEGAPS
jgi:signal transduction histidine kinase